MGSHASSTATNFFSSCQRLAFPCVWVSAKQRTDVPAPPQLSQLKRGVTARLCHGWIVVWQSPSMRPARLPWGRSMEIMTSPVDVHWSIHRGWVKTLGNMVWCGSGCLQNCLYLVEGVDISSPLMPSDSGLNDCHDYPQN